MIFLSYSRQDSNFAKQLIIEISECGYEVILDPTLVEGDPFWRNSVMENLTKTTVVLVLWSKHSALSPWVDQELRAFNGEKKFIPLDQTTVPEKYKTHVINKQNIKQILSKMVLPKSNFLQHNLQATEKIKELRLLKFREWEEKLDAFSKKHKAPASLQRLSETEWLSKDGSIAKQIHESSKKVKKDEIVTLVSTTPVSNKQYKIFAEAVQWPEPSCFQLENFRNDESPVVGITWFEAMAYANWQGGGLPSVNEWERSARQAGKDSVYATNNNKLTHENGFFLTSFGKGNPVNAKSYPSNSNSFYGLCGNTWDWCRDWKENFCVIKGGGYMDSAEFCKISAEYRNSPIDRDCCVGFRLQFQIKPE